MYHSYFIGRLRVCLDVEVESGDHAPAKYGHAGNGRILAELPPEERPLFVKGDLAYGTEEFLCQCEVRGQRYLFKLRQSPMVKTLINTMERTSGWVDAGQGFEGIESRLQLKAWRRERRVIILRRLVKSAVPAKGELPLMEQNEVTVESTPTHESMVLVTDFDAPILGIAQLYRESKTWPAARRWRDSWRSCIIGGACSSASWNRTNTPRPLPVARNPYTAWAA